jgi:hypothetical protein
MYCKIIEEVSRGPLGEIQFEKNGEKKQKGPNVFIEPMGGVEIFQGNPLTLIQTAGGCI